MRLTTFTIKNYKIIDDTGPIKADELVTALVGKNESGKSAVMRAIWKSKNVANAQFDKLYDFPRDRYSRERRQTQEVTRLEFALTEEERAELMKQLPADAAPGPTSVTLVTYYEGEEKTKSEVTCEWEMKDMPTGRNASAAIEALIREVTSAGEAETVLAANSQEISLDAPLWEDSVRKIMEAVHAAATQWSAKDETHKTAAVGERDALAALIKRAKDGDPRAKAHKWAEDNLPSFIYFDQYGTLRTLIHLPSYLGRKDKPDAETRTQTALFEWSGLDPVEIMQLGRPREQNETEVQVHRRHEKRRALLDSASFALTGDWLHWWPGGDHQLVFDVDGEFLVLKVSDKANPFALPFEERSQGFQWFFSFYLVFLVESKKAHKGAILLLDEPGLHLHPTRQMKLINFFERVAEGNQLIYSTHLPFLVDGNRLDRVRTVHLTATEPAKTVVSANVRPTGDRDTLFPLQAALGYSIAQTLFMGKRTVIVEGITDYWFIKALDSIIAADGTGSGLADVVLVPAGGTSRLMPLASVMLSSMEGVAGSLVVMLDSDTEGARAGKRVEDAFGIQAPVIMLGTALGRAEATIEDLIPRATYVDAVNRAGHKIELNDSELKAAMNVDAVEMAIQRLGLGAFGVTERAAVALLILGEWGKDPAKVPAATKAAGLALIGAINRHFSS